MTASDMVSEEKRTWRTSLRRRAYFFLVICVVIFLKVVWMSMDSDEMSDADRIRQRRVWLGDRYNVSQVLGAQLTRGTTFTSNYTDVDFRIPREKLRSRPNPRLDGVNCRAMYNGDKAEMERARQRMYASPKQVASDYDYIKQTMDCESFRQSRGYIMQPLSKEENEFPIAFSLLMYDDVEQVERLLRAVYAPQNFYCIHVDLKAADSIHIAVRSIARCFPNVFVASRLESVYWGHISIMYAEMNCLTDLLQYQWKYFINLSGQMFPLHTNRELVKILKLYDGANDIEGTYKRSRNFWLTVRQTLSWRLYESLNMMLLTIYPKSSAPHNITIYKGSNQIVASRAFAIYFMHSPIAKDLVEWFADTLAPDEYLWPTINHNPHLHAPGGYKGDPETKTFTARASIWLPVANQVNWSWDYWECQGKWVREICIFGVGDMPWLYHRPELFANKFHSKFEWLAYDCMEELLFNRTLAGDQIPFDSSYYEKLPFVKHKELVTTPEEAMNGTVA